MTDEARTGATREEAGTGGADAASAAKARADAALDAVLAEGAEIRDPRPYCRLVLKHLRERDAAAFSRAIAHFETELVPALAAGSDPVTGWLEYGLRLAAELGGGRLLEVDSTGRALPIADARDAGGLVLYVPDADDAPVLVLRHPTTGSRAQDATVELLVAGRVTASAYE